MIKGVFEKHTINWIMRKAKAGHLDFSISIQRKEVWNAEHKSNLIVSILMGIPIESLLFEEERDCEKFMVLDGKQRTTDIVQFVSNEFALSEKILIRELEGVDLVGKKFEDLPDDFKERIMDYELSISMLRPLEEEEREVIFFMRNQAVPLTGVELVRVLLGSSVMDTVEQLSKHEVLQKFNVSTSRYQDQQVVLEMLAVQMGEEIGFTSSELKSFAQRLKTNGIGKLDFNNVISTFTFLNEIIEKKEKILKKVNVPILYHVATKALNEGVSAVNFKSWMNHFFGAMPERYAELLQSGVNGKNNVLERKRIMEENYRAYLSN